MHEQPMLVACLQGQASHPCDMLGWQITRIIHAVAFKRLLATVAPPRHEIAIRAILLGRPDQHLFVVTTQADESAVRIGLISDQKVDHFLAVWASVDVVADRDESDIMVGAMLMTGSEKRAQFLVAAVDVTDCEDE